jgi:hypothetical protein
VKSAVFAISAATAILGHSPVLQFSPDDRRENPRKFRRGKNYKRSFCI